MIFRGMSRLWKRLVTKLVILLLVFLTVPVVLYVQFRNADAERNALLLSTIREEGRLIARGLQPHLEAFDRSSPVQLDAAVAHFGDERLSIRLLFRPVGAARLDNFFYIASAPPLPLDHLEVERRELTRSGAFDALDATCAGDLPRSLRYQNPSGERLVLTSLTPVNVPAGCWVVVTSHSAESLASSSIAYPYWMRPEVQIAAFVYVLTVIIVVSLFGTIWRNILRFERHARRVRHGRSRGSFVKANRIPELHEVAGTLDSMVDSLRASQAMIRQAAEENAHALKGPLAVMAQALEPLKRAVPADDRRARRSLDLIARSVEKLDRLVSAARRMDEAMAALLDPPRQRVDLVDLVERVAATYAESAAARGVTVEAHTAGSCTVFADPSLLETAIENLVDNAVSFVSEGGRVGLALKADDTRAELCIEDDGPGVPEGRLERIFDRYYTLRPQDASSDAGKPAETSAHDGIGLWVVRRNVEAFGGSVLAENRPEGGLRVIIRLPSSRAGPIGS